MFGRLWTTQVISKYASHTVTRDDEHLPRPFHTKSPFPVIGDLRCGQNYIPAGWSHKQSGQGRPGGVVVYQYTQKKFAKIPKNTQNSSKYTQNYTQVYFIPEIQRKWYTEYPYLKIEAAIYHIPDLKSPVYRIPKNPGRPCSGELSSTELTELEKLN